MQVISRCSLPATGFVWQPGAAVWTLTVVTKATFALSPELSPLADVQQPIVWEDSHWDDDPRRSLHAMTDLVPFKKAPELLVKGCAYAPAGAPVRRLRARVAVGVVDKAVDVYGDRFFDFEGRLSEPSPFEKLYLSWERASRGALGWNPAGVPMGGEARPDGWGRVAAPNLQPAGSHLASRADVLPPVGFGPIAPSWPGRASRLPRGLARWDVAGWKERPLPSGLDAGCFSAAPDDQILTQIAEEERVTLEGLHPDHPVLVTRLKGPRPLALATVEGDPPSPVPLVADTLLIDTDARTITLTYRGQLRLSHPSRQGWVVVTLAETVAPTFSARAASGLRPPAEAARAASGLRPPAEAARAASGLRPPADVAPAEEETTSAYLIPDEDVLVDEGTMRLHVLPGTDRIDAPSDVPAPPNAPEIAAPQRAASEPAWLAQAHAAGPPEREDAGGALPFNRPAGAQVGRMALGRSARLQALMDLPPAAVHPAPPPAPPPAELKPSVVTDRMYSDEILDEQTADPLPSGEMPPGLVRVITRSPPLVVEPPPPAFVGDPSPPALLFEPSPPAFVVDPSPPALLIEPSPPVFVGDPSPPALLIEPPPPMFVGDPPPPALLTEPSPPPVAPPADKAEAPPQVQVEGPPAEQAISIKDFPIEQCAALDASLARSPGEKDALLRATDIAEADWRRLRTAWAEEIQRESRRGRTAPLRAYDAAYVGRLEQERGPITVQEYARILVGMERGDPAAPLRAAGLPDEAAIRIQRIWIRKAATDPALGAALRSAVEKARAE